MKTQWLAAIVLVSISSSDGSAQTALWSQMALEDIRAAKKLLVDNHPAAVPELGDSAFQDALRGAAEFEQLAARVTTFAGYRAAIDRFAASFGDRHIAQYPVVDVPKRWPGFLVALTRGGWRTHGGTERLPNGSMLIECDNIQPNVLAERNLKPRVPDWSLRAQRLAAAPRLLVDEGDPSVTRPSRCVFEIPDGSTTELTLEWTSIEHRDLEKNIREARRGVSLTNGMTLFRDGWWIRLGTFLEEVLPTIEKTLRTPELRLAPFLILDVRGNVGGSSAYGTKLAEFLYGRGAVEQARKMFATSEDDTPVWRTSPGNLRLIDEFAMRFRKQFGPSDPTTQYFVRQGDAMRIALANGDTFSQAFPAERAQEGPTQENISRPPRVFLLTDSACFSACLEFVQLFRALGATQLGDETDGGLNYFEVRAVPLPSGLSLFTTLQAFTRARPLRLGPFTPHQVFEGDPSKESEVERWVATLLGRELGAR